MPKSKTPTQNPFPLRYVEEVGQSVSRFSSLPTPTNIKQTTLFGIPLQSAFTGEELSDEAIQFYINSAISEIEHTLDLHISPVRFYEKHDYERSKFTWDYAYLKVDHP